MPKKFMATKVPENMHEATTDNKKDRLERSFLLCENFFVKTIKALTYL